MEDDLCPPECETPLVHVYPLEFADFDVFGESARCSCMLDEDCTLYRVAKCVHCTIARVLG